MDGLAESLGRSPELFPHAFDERDNTVALIRLARSDYEKASFLDQRVLTPRTIGRKVPWRQVAAAVETARLAERCGFIFHIGHVGSTLISRLLGAHRTVFALREPLILRGFTQMRSDPELQPQIWNADEFESRVSCGLKLFSRTFEPQQLAIVKATSFVSEIAGELLARAYAPKALMMFVSPESYLATILGGPNSRQEARMFTPGRLKRLSRRLEREEPWRLASLGEGEALALSWACEMTALAAAARSAGARATVLDFDAFLNEPALHLRAAFRHFDIVIDARATQAILAGPDMQRYSKAPEHAYDANLRRDVLNQARAQHAPQIRQGLAWLDRAAGEFPVIREALEFSQISAR
jgi:hypothetical protein